MRGVTRDFIPQLLVLCAGITTIDHGAHQIALVVDEDSFDTVVNKKKILTA